LNFNVVFPLWQT